MKNPAIARRRLTEDCGSKVRGYVRDLPGTYLVRVPGTDCHKALFVCEIKSPICFGFMPSLYLVKSASSARLFAGLQLLVLRFSGRDTPCRMSDRGGCSGWRRGGERGLIFHGCICFFVYHVVKLRLFPYRVRKSKKRNMFSNSPGKKTVHHGRLRRYSVTVLQCYSYS